MTSPSRLPAKQWLAYPWFVVLLSAYPVLALAAANIHQIRIDAIFRPLIISIIGGCALWGILSLCLRHWQRAAFLSAWLIVLFYSYGHVYRLLHDLSPQLGRGRYLVPLWGLLAMLAAFWSTRKSLSLPFLARLFNLIAAALTLSAGVQIAWFHSQTEAHFQETWSAGNISASTPGERPDIYYIILDSYGRSDVLADTYGIDNTAFLQQLSDMGFYIASCSQSNYAQTSLALASTLNGDYLENLEVRGDSERNDALLIALARHNRTRRFLESLGYRTVSFASGFIWSEWTDAALYLSPPMSGRTTEFEGLLMRSSFGLALLDAGIIPIHRESASSFRERTLYALETLPNLATLEGPKFVFVHLIVPHPPFVFGPNGESRETGSYTLESQYSSEQYRQGYREQVEFINKRLVPVLEHILNRSARPVVILLQGDHGPGFSSWGDRMKILNAYYLPAGRERLYPSISPVNSFRLLLNAYFGATYPLLEDRSFFSSYNTPYDFQEIENRCTTGITSP